MIKSILVPVTGSAADAAAFATALAVARVSAAHLDFLHVRIDPVTLASSMATDGAGVLAGGMIERLEEEADTREREARRAFDDFCRQNDVVVAERPGAAGPSAGWHREAGAEPYWIAVHGRAADLIVISRPVGDAGVLTESIEAALLDTGRPLLLAPAEGLTVLPENVVIAWKGRPEAARAVAAAMPVIERARRVDILTVDEAEPPPDDAADRLAAALGWHGIAASATRLPPGEGGAGETLIEAARERNALLVMGGYGHSRLREWVFGGVTDRVLRAAASLPVLMAH